MDERSVRVSWCPLRPGVCCDGSLDVIRIQDLEFLFVGMYSVAMVGYNNGVCGPLSAGVRINICEIHQGN